MENKHKEAAAQAATRANDRDEFTAAVNAIINQNPDITFSVSTINLNDDSRINVGQGSAMNAASCGKVLSAVLFLHDVQNGSESLDEDIGGGNSRYELQQMIQQSDDNAWVAFNEDLGHPALLAYAQSLGLNSYNPDIDYISAADMSTLLQKLFGGELLNSSNTKLLLSFMQNTNYEDFIPPAVPSGYQVYHKVGFVDGEINDAAIITNGRQKFVLSIFSNSNSNLDPQTRANIMQQITKAALLHIP